MKKEDLPNKIPVFPLSNFILFPRTSVPLNIFEPRYVDMINDSMKSNKFIGMIQPKNFKVSDKINPELYEVGCLGKITGFNEVKENQFLIQLKGIIRFKIYKETISNKKYRECEVKFDNYYDDLINKKEDLKFSRFRINF